MSKDTYTFRTGQPSLSIMGVATIMPDGSVVLADGVSLDDASKKFWEAIATWNPAKARIAELTEALKPFARLADDDVLSIIAAKLPPLVSFLQFTRADGEVIAKIELADLHRAASALKGSQT